MIEYDNFDKTFSQDAPFPPCPSTYILMEANPGFLVGDEGLDLLWCQLWAFPMGAKLCYSHTTVLTYIKHVFLLHYTCVNVLQEKGLFFNQLFSESHWATIVPKIFKKAAEYTAKLKLELRQNVIILAKILYPKLFWNFTIGLKSTAMYSRGSQKSGSCLVIPNEPNWTYMNPSEH